MNPVVIVLLIWLGTAAMMIGAGLILSRRRGPDRYLVMTIVKLEGSSPDEPLEYREAA